MAVAPSGRNDAADDVSGALGSIGVHDGQVARVCDSDGENTLLSVFPPRVDPFQRRPFEDPNSIDKVDGPSGQRSFALVGVPFVGSGQVYV
jgi:hypothetical protein